MVDHSAELPAPSKSEIWNVLWGVCLEVSILRLLLAVHAGEERQQTAGRCLGELVRKMGDRILSQIVPILQHGIASEDPAQRQGLHVFPELVYQCPLSRSW